MIQAFLIFPNQLFENPKINDLNVYLWESNLHFSQYNFHKQKLVLHQASMKYYKDYLIEKGCLVKYLECKEFPKMLNIFELFSNLKIDKIVTYQPYDYLQERRLTRYSEQFKIEVDFIENPNFITNHDEFDELLGSKYFMAKFYQKQRKKLNILMEGDSPLGGKYSFDTDNRKKLPKAYQTKALPNINSKYIDEAQKFASNNYPQNYGSIDNFNFPVTHKQAKGWLDDFLLQRMEYFGDFEDAISKHEEFINHSVLTPSLNIGLLNPKQIIDRTLELNEKYNYSINSLEGFIRQIIGWREFMLGIYIKEGTRQRLSNFWGFERKIPSNFYNATTGIEPVDDTIQKLLKNSYNHHIERLMVLGNFMLLCEIHPDSVHKWFMELYIDAYDWVMVPNIYGMSQYSDGGLITTKPYISGSNYILKMSDYKKGDWCQVWDALYWRFIHKYQDKLRGNFRMSMMLNLVNKKSSEQINRYYQIADEFLEKLK